MKPIEPGCLALHAPYTYQNFDPDGREYFFSVDAHVCLVKGPLGHPRRRPCPFCAGTAGWAIDSPAVKATQLYPRNTNICACRLTRIDGHDPDAETETTKEEITHGE